MNLPSQSIRSPESPYEYRSKHSFYSHKPGYPNTPQPESLTLGQASHHGLGLFGCPSQVAVAELPPSPQPSDSWSHSSLMDQDFAPTTQPPNVFSAAYDPFSGFSTSSNTGMASAHSPEAPGLDYCQSPPGSNLPSHRSSVSSSYAGSEALSHRDSDFTYTPRVKVEDASEWFPSAGNTHVLSRNLSTQSPSDFSHNMSNLNSPTEDLYNPRHAECSKANGSTYLTGLQPPSDARLPTRFDVQSILPSVNRIKKKRQRTTPEEATHECQVCGKLFKRSYNWKSHLETHNPERKYPHPCTSMAGNSPCTKKFQRKTDLDRHIDSVHLKARNHRCTLCGHGFARRDTLRRHTEDGCAKRFDVGFREGSTATPARWSFTNFPAQRTRSFSALGNTQPSPNGPPSSSAPAPSTATFPMLNRPEYSGVGNTSPTYQS
ncbi:transcriptional regulator prz1 [Lasallia pustulata]|uniref:Transcriptional regulator prz1 n=1 Tax=Lasallia pustulata TaxID=136370 RepID=A0A1W5DBA9_9LECA|nr:transcriptional regulator prz1 [Lasallia pustulata]